MSATASFDPMKEKRSRYGPPKRVPLTPWEQRAERLMRGPRGLHTRLQAAGVSYRQAERVLGHAANTAGEWARRWRYPRFAHAMRLRALVRDVERGMDVARAPDGFYAGAERPNLTAWLDDAVAEGWTLKGIAARSGVRPAAVQSVRHGGGISLPLGLRLAAFLRKARAGTIEPARRRPAQRWPKIVMPGCGPSRGPYAGLFGT